MDVAKCMDYFNFTALQCGMLTNRNNLYRLCIYQEFYNNRRCIYD